MVIFEEFAVTEDDRRTVDDDAHEVLATVRQVWRDGDRPVDFDDEYRDEAA